MLYANPPSGPQRGSGKVIPARRAPGYKPGSKLWGVPTYVVKPPKPGRVVAKGPTSTVTRPGAPHAVASVAKTKTPNVPHPSGPKIGQPKRTFVPPKNPAGYAGGGVTYKRSPKVPPTGGGPHAAAGGGVGFDPVRLAKTLTNLGYDADISAINKQISDNQNNMESALADIHGWANQIEGQRASGAAEGQAARNKAGQEMAANEAHIADLFGGAAGGEAGAYGGVGQDMLSTIGASDASFDSRMKSILGAQGLDYTRRARQGFEQQGQDLEASLRAKQAEKGQAYSGNLANLMDMAWGRKQDIFKNQMAKQAFDQAQQLQGYNVAGKQLDLARGAQQIQSGDLAIKAQKLALKTSNAKLAALQNKSGGGLDWSNPNTAAQLANATFTGALAKNGTFTINPKLAYQNAQMLAAQYGAQGDPRAAAAIWNQFNVLLNLTHAHKRWGQYFVNPKGQLVYDPTRKFKH